jgi:hypothetical protein
MECETAKDDLDAGAQRDIEALIELLKSEGRPVLPGHDGSRAYWHWRSVRFGFIFGPVPSGRNRLADRASSHRRPSDVPGLVDGRGPDRQNARAQGARARRCRHAKVAQSPTGQRRLRVKFEGRAAQHCLIRFCLAQGLEQPAPHGRSHASTLPMHATAPVRHRGTARTVHRPCGDLTHTPGAEYDAVSAW